MCLKNPSESGQPCGFVPCAEYEALQDERDALVQVSADICPDCGWAMKFPDEPCRNCEVHSLRKENAKLREDRNALRAVVEKADALADLARQVIVSDGPLKTIAEDRLAAYQEARHG